jgi:hypothetical protein
MLCMIQKTKAKELSSTIREPRDVGNYMYACYLPLPRNPPLWDGSLLIPYQRQGRSWVWRWKLREHWRRLTLRQPRPEAGNAKLVTVTGTLTMQSASSLASSWSKLRAPAQCNCFFACKVFIDLLWFLSWSRTWGVGTFFLGPCCSKKMGGFEKDIAYQGFLWADLLTNCKFCQRGVTFK